jgi:D-3-phosphoglycerate dehydrogenase
MKIVLAESLASPGVRLLKEQPGWEVIESNPKEFLAHLPDADALIVANAVRVNAAMLAQAPLLRVVGRAGVGIDNIDIAAATAAGVLAMNTPGGNSVSVAEHTLALMLSLARSIPQASASIKAGRWEKRKFLGSELREKVLGVIGIGSIGREVVKRAKAFEMRVIAHDPYVNSKTAADVGVELVELNSLYAQADYITLHTALTPESVRMLNADAFAKMKPGMRVINCARGELIDQQALKAAIDTGKVAGAALDVFEKEPPVADDPLIASDRVIATPHIGGSTEEARGILGVRIAEQIVEYLQNGVAINAVNMPALTREQFRTLGPYGALAERLGNLASHVAQGNPRTVRIVYYGKILEHNTQLVRNAAVAGVVNRSLAHRANAINAMQIANDRGLVVAERHDRRAGHVDTIMIEIETDAGITTVEGAVVLGKPRLIQVDGIHCEAPLEGHVTFLRNDDVPGVIGYIGGVLGSNGINIGSFSLGRLEPLAQAISMIATDDAVPEKVLAQLMENKAVTSARSLRFY